MTWQNPWAWAGLVTLALPALVHLLSRAPATLRRFPSLRFIDASRLSPRRRTRPRDLLLLAVRTGILAAAVAALAGPDFGGRRAGSPRIVRAIVLDTSRSMLRPAATGTGTVLDGARRVAAGIADSGRANDAMSIVVPTAQPLAAIPGVLSWLETQPGTHEIVVVSDFQRDGFDVTTLRTIPARYGLRLVRVDGAPIDSTFTIPADYPAAQVRVTARPNATELLWTAQRDSASVTPASRYTVTLRAGDVERVRLSAAVAATLGAGSIGTRVHLDSAPPGNDSTRAVEIVYPTFAGRAALLARATAPSDPRTAAVIVRLSQDDLLQDVARSSRVADASPEGSRDSESSFVAVARNAGGRALVIAAQDSANGQSRLLLFSHADAGSPLSAALVAATLRAVVPPPSLAEREPLATSEAELRALARTATDTGMTAATSSDPTGSIGRWLWVLALALLGVEALLRRTAAPQTGNVSDAGDRDEAVAA